MCHKTIKDRLTFFFLVTVIFIFSANAFASEKKTFAHGGLDRSYWIYIPDTWNKADPKPLLVVLHGGWGSGEKIQKLNYEGFNKLADKEGFIVAYPDGIGGHWNDGRTQTRFRAQRQNIDDVGFISSLIDYLIKEMNIDPKRVYVTGVSNGAMMTYRLACEITGKLAAVAPVIGSMPDAYASKCSPSRSISVLAINGTEDPLVPYKGGDIRFGPFGITLGKVKSVPETVNFWATFDKCSFPPEVTYEPDRNPGDQTKVRREFYRNCQDGAEVILYAVEGGGHTWPGGMQYRSESLIGRTSKDIDATTVIWEFLKHHAIK